MKIIYLDYDEAIELATRENIECDQRGKLLSEVVPQEELEIYEDEAAEMLARFGENFDPEYPDHHKIYLNK